MSNNELFFSQIQILNGIQSLAFTKIGSYLESGDSVPNIVSSVIWQSAKEITSILVESVAQDEISVIRKSKLVDELEGIKELYIEQLMTNTLGRVYDALYSEVSPENRSPSGLGLMRKSIQELDEYNQDRVMAINLGIPYNSYMILINIFTMYPELCEILLARKGEIRILSNGSLLLRLTMKRENSVVSIPHIPGTTVDTIKTTDYVDVKQGSISIISGGGYQQSITIPPDILKFYEVLRSSPVDRQKIRNIIIEKYRDNCVWKNTFSKGNEKKNSEKTLDGRLIF